MNVTIVGGGSSAHLLAVLLAGRGHGVTVLTRRPQAWSQDLELEDGDRLLTGRIRAAMDNPVVALADADLAILCMPVHQYPNALRWMAPGVRQNPTCIVGTVYGQAGFDWMVKGLAKQTGIMIENYFAIGLLPWIARTRQYGKRAVSYGPKLHNGIACSSEAVFNRLSAEVLDDFSVSYWGMGRFELVPNFITLTLTVDNQIIHPSRCFALTKEGGVWKSPEDIPYFYRDFDDFSAQILQGVDRDYDAIRRALVACIPSCDNAYMLDYLDLEHWSYGSHNPDIRSSFVNSTTLRDIKPPTVQCPDGLWRLDVNHRFFKDDLAYGLDIALWFAEQLGVEVPHIQTIIDWYERDIVPLGEGRVASATPEMYGLTLKEAIEG